MNNNIGVTRYQKSIPSPDDIPLRFKNLGAVTYLTHGSTCHVFRIIGPKEYILKVVPCGDNEAYYQRTLYELRIMEELNSESCVVRLCDYEIVNKDENRTVYILEEFHNAMFQCLYRTSFDVIDALQLTINICDALLVLKNHGILHLDVKPGNIFIDNESNVRIGDFSHSLFLKDVPLHHGPRGTLPFMAPEVYREGLYSEQSDVYSLGLVLYTLFKDMKLPFMDKDSHDTAIYKRLAGMRLPYVYIDLPYNAANDELNRIICKACAFRCEDRYKGFEEFKSDLSNVLKFVQTNAYANTSLYMPTDILYPGGEQSVIYVLQTTASMAGQPIDELNYIVQKTSEAINERAVGEFEIIESALVCGDNLEWVSMNKDIVDDSKTFSASGLTNIGLALDELNRKLNSSPISSLGYNKPIIIFVVKNLNDNDVETALSKLKMNKRFMCSIKIGFVVGNQDGRANLEKLTGSSASVLSVDEIDSFKNLFEFVSESSRVLDEDTWIVNDYNDDDTFGPDDYDEHEDIPVLNYDDED